MADFDLQTYLIEWRRENREDTNRMLAAFHEHEVKDLTRFSHIDDLLAPLTATYGTLKWVVRSIVVAVLGAAVDLFYHLFRH